MPIKMDLQQICREFREHLHQNRVDKVQELIQLYPVPICTAYHETIYEHCRSMEMFQFMQEKMFQLQITQELIIHLIRESMSCLDLEPVLEHLRTIEWLDEHTFVKFANVEEARTFHRWGIDLGDNVIRTHNIDYAVKRDDVELVAYLLEHGSHDLGDILPRSIEMVELFKQHNVTVAKNLIIKLFQSQQLPSLELLDYAQKNGSQVPSNTIAELMKYDPPHRYYVWAYRIGCRATGQRLIYAKTVEQIDILMRLGANPNDICTFRSKQRTVFEHIYAKGGEKSEFLLQLGYRPRDRKWTTEHATSTRRNIVHGIAMKLQQCHQETIQTLLLEAHPPIPQNAIQRDMLKISFWARTHPDKFEMFKGLLFHKCVEYFELVQNLAKLPRHLVKEIIQWSCYPVHN